MRSFSRTDEEYRPTYELIRQGKMPESESLLGKLLNRLLGPEDEDVLREQQIDGSQLPDFEAVRRYLGPAGLFLRIEKRRLVRHRNLARQTGNLCRGDSPARHRHAGLGRNRGRDKF